MKANTETSHFGERLGGTWSVVELLLVITIIGLLVFLTMPARADNTSPYGLAPQQANFYRKDTAAFPFTMTNGAGISFPAGGTNSLKLPLRQGKGVSFFLQMGGPTTTGSETLKFDLTPDGTNFTTVQPIQWTITPGSLTGGLWWTNIPPTVLDNIRAIQLTVGTNTFSSTWYATNFWYSYSGQ